MRHNEATRRRNLCEGRSLSRGASCYFYTIVVNELIPGIPETFTNEPPKLFFRGWRTRGGFLRCFCSVISPAAARRNRKNVMVSAAPVKQCRNKHLKQGFVIVCSVLHHWTLLQIFSQCPSGRTGGFEDLTHRKSTHMEENGDVAHWVFNF